MQRSIVLKSTGFSGLGDLLLALRRAIMAAQATERSLIVDWRDTPYSRGEISLFDELFILSGVQQSSVQSLENAQGTVFPPAWQGRLNQSFRQVYSDHCDQDWNRALAVKNLDAGITCLKSNAEWVVLWDHIDPPSPSHASSWHVDVNRSPLATLLRPSQRIEETIKSFRQKSFALSMIGAHVRLGSDAIQAGKSVSCEHFYAQIDQLRSLHPSAGVFLASDNQDVVASFLDRYPDVVIRSKWLPEPGKAVHLAEGVSASGVAIAEDALVDLYLLASCHWIIHPSQSSFSIAAARCSGLSSTQIYPLSQSSSSVSTRWQWPNTGWIDEPEMWSIPADELAMSAEIEKDPVMSILMMTRNHEEYLEKAIESVICQDFPYPYEILIGEDCSTDSTLDVALTLQARWPKLIRIVTAAKNVGIRSNFLRLVVRARGEYLALLEGDDYWIDPAKLRLQFNYLNKHPECALVAAKTENRIQWLPEKSLYCLSDVLKRYVVHTSTLVIRAQHLRSYPRFPDNVCWETMLLGYLLARGTCGFLPVSLSYYRRHHGGLWHNADRMKRLEMSWQCIDALDSFFYGRFRTELIDREFWIYSMDWQLPVESTWDHWLGSWRILIRKHKRMISRAPVKTLLLVLFTLVQPLLVANQRLRGKLALRERLPFLPRST